MLVSHVSSVVFCGCSLLSWLAWFQRTLCVHHFHSLLSILATYLSVCLKLPSAPAAARAEGCLLSPSLDSQSSFFGAHLACSRPFLHLDHDSRACAGGSSMVFCPVVLVLLSAFSRILTVLLPFSERGRCCQLFSMAATFSSVARPSGLALHKDLSMLPSLLLLEAGRSSAKPFFF